MMYTLSKYRGLTAPLLLTATIAWGEEKQEDAKRLQPPLEMLTVTAEILNRSLLNSANSAKILNESALKSNAGLITLRDILATTANISVVSGTGKAPSVRGVDGTGPAENANAFFAGSRARLSWQIDNRPASYNEVVFGDLGLFDVERVEVLRGPQSSLVGRNAIAGTVIVHSHDPIFEPEGLGQVVGGNNGQKRTSAMVNIPITDDKLALRLSADWFQRDSAVNYDAFPGVDHPERMEGLSLRGKVLLLPEDQRNSRLLITLSHTAYSGPNSEIIVRPFEQRRSNFPRQPQHEPQTTSIAADYAVDVNSRWRMQLNASATDFDFARNASPNTSNATIDTREYIVQPQLHYDNAAGLSAVTGVYYYRARQDEFIEFVAEQNFDDQTDTFAIYAEGIVPISDALELSLGIRSEEEKRQREGGDATGTIAQISYKERYRQVLPKVGINWRATKNTRWGIQISKGYNAGGGGVTFNFPIVNYEYKEETVWTQDIYGRQEFFDGKILTTQSLFYSQYQDMQLPFDLTPNDSSDEAFIVRNADKVETWGLELGITASLTNALDVWGNIARLSTDVSKFPNSGIEGKHLLTAPELSANLGLTWTTGNWSTSVATRYSDRYFTDVNNRPGGRTDAYIIADAQLAYETGPARLFCRIKNIFDTDKAVARYPGVAPTDSTEPDSTFDSAVLLQPRTFVVGAQIKF